MFESRLSHWSVRCAVPWMVDGRWWTVGLSRGWEYLRWRGEEQRGRKRNGEGGRQIDVITTNFLRIGGE
jgi:hypothetical protein